MTNMIPTFKSPDGQPARRVASLSECLWMPQGTLVQTDTALFRVTQDRGQGYVRVTKVNSWEIRKGQERYAVREVIPTTGLHPFDSAADAQAWGWSSFTAGTRRGPWSCVVRLSECVRRVTYLPGATYWGSAVVVPEEPADDPKRCSYCGRGKRGWRTLSADTVCADCERQMRQS